MNNCLARISKKQCFLILSPLRHYLIAQQDSSHSLFSTGKWEGTAVSFSAIYLSDILPMFFHLALTTNRWGKWDPWKSWDRPTSPIWTSQPSLSVVSHCFPQDFFLVVVFNEVWCHPPQHHVISHGYRQIVVEIDPLHLLGTFSEEEIVVSTGDKGGLWSIFVCSIPPSWKRWFVFNNCQLYLFPHEDSSQSSQVFVHFPLHLPQGDPNCWIPRVICFFLFGIFHC